MLEKEIYSENKRRFNSLKKELTPKNLEIKRIQYTFNFPEYPQRPEGDALVVYGHLDYLKYIKEDKLLDALKQKNIDLTDIIANIKEFYPNSRGKKEEIEKYIRRGFGSEILNFLMEESKKNGAKVICVVTWRDPMVRRISKRGFQPVHIPNMRDTRFYKILPER